MFDTHILTIVPMDGTCVCDSFAITELDFSSCNIPNNIHALQWNRPPYPTKDKSYLSGLEYGQGEGWIEYASPNPNLKITTLPQWALDAYEVAKQSYINQNI